MKMVHSDNRQMTARLGIAKRPIVSLFFIVAEGLSTLGFLSQPLIFLASSFDQAKEEGAMSGVDLFLCGFVYS